MACHEVGDRRAGPAIGDGRHDSPCGPGECQCCKMRRRTQSGVHILQLVRSLLCHPLASRTSTGVNSTPSDGVTAWIAANWPVPEVIGGISNDCRSRRWRSFGPNLRWCEACGSQTLPHDGQGPPFAHRKIPNLDNCLSRAPGRVGDRSAQSSKSSSSSRGAPSPAGCGAVGRCRNCGMWRSRGSRVSRAARSAGSRPIFGCSSTMSRKTSA